MQNFEPMEIWHDNKSGSWAAELLKVIVKVAWIIRFTLFSESWMWLIVHLNSATEYYKNGYFKKYIINKNRTIKDILMDQKFVSGLGNIYVNETLFFSGIKPTKKVKNLSESEIRKIIKFTKIIQSKYVK